MDASLVDPREPLGIKRKANDEGLSDAVLATKRLILGTSFDGLDGIMNKEGTSVSGTAIVGDSKPLDLKEIYGEQPNLADVLNSLVNEDPNRRFGFKKILPKGTLPVPAVPTKFCPKCENTVIPLQHRVNKLDAKVKGMISMLKTSLQNDSPLLLKNPSLLPNQSYRYEPLKTPLIIRPASKPINLTQKMTVRTPNSLPRLIPATSLSLARSSTSLSLPSTSTPLNLLKPSNSGKEVSKIIFDTYAGVSKPRYIPYKELLAGQTSEKKTPTSTTPPVKMTPTLTMAARENTAETKSFQKGASTTKGTISALPFDKTKANYVRAILLHPKAEFTYGDFIKANSEITKGLTKRQVEMILRNLSEDELLYQEEEDDSATALETVWQKETTKSRLNKLKKYGITYEEFAETLE